MKISRYIWFPLIFVFYYALQAVLSYEHVTLNKILFHAVLGAILGFTMIQWSKSKALKLTGRKDEEVLKPHQERTISVLLDFNQTFELCKDAVLSLNPAKIKEESLETGVLKFRTKLRWSNWGDVITINLRKINKSLTEVNISTQPIPRTALIGNGRNWKDTEDICNYLKEKDTEINRKILIESTTVLEKIYIEPFSKEKEST